MVEFSLGVIKVPNRKFDVEVVYDRCKACGICIHVCPTKVFGQRNDFKAYPAHPEKCVGCMLCVYSCPDFAIKVYELVEEEG